MSDKEEKATILATVRQDEQKSKMRLMLEAKEKVDEFIGMTTVFLDEKAHGNVKVFRAITETGFPIFEFWLSWDKQSHTWRFGGMGGSDSEVWADLNRIVNNP